MKDRSYKITEF